MTTQNDNRLKQIQIKIKCNSKCFNINVQPYKTIKYVKDRAKKYFYPITNVNISLWYQNKDLNQFESFLLGEFFKNKSIVCLCLIPSTTPRNQSAKKLRLNESINYKAEYQQYNCYCNKGIMSYYCRSCFDFICTSCKISDKHLKHSTIHVDVNQFEDSIKLYALTLQNDIQTNMQSIKEYNSLRNSKSNTISPHNNIVNSKEEVFLSKIEEIKSMYKDMRSVLGNYLNNNNKDKYEKIIAEYNQTAKEANNNLEQFIIDFHSKYTQQGNNKISYKEMISLFNLIQKKENEYNEKTKDALAYSINYELNMTINMMYTKLEKIINEFYSNSLFHFSLSTNSYHIYSLIKSQYISRNIFERKTGKGAQLTKKNEYPSTKTYSNNSQSKYSITAIDKNDRNKRNEKKKITFSSNIFTCNNDNEEQHQNMYRCQERKIGDTFFSNKETGKANVLSRVNTRELNDHNITQFFNGGKSRTPIKYMTHKMIPQTKSVSEDKRDGNSINDLVLDYHENTHNNHNQRNISMSSVSKIDEIFDK